MFKPLDNNAGFLLDVEGRKVVAVKLPGNVAREIAGQHVSLSGGVLTKLARLWRSAEPERWLIVANMGKVLFEDNPRFTALVAEGLTKATGVTVPLENLVISESKVVGVTEKQTDSSTVTQSVEP